MGLRLSREALDLQLRRLYLESDLPRKIESLRRQVLDSPKQDPGIDLTKLVNSQLRRLNQKVALGILSWYFPEEISFLTRLFLEETWGTDSKEVLEILLTSKDAALAFLQIQDQWGERDFFGNILNRRTLALLGKTSFRRLKTNKVTRYSGYCRGYQESSRPRSSIDLRWSELGEEYRQKVNDLVAAREIAFQLRLFQLKEKIEYQVRNFP